MCGFFRAQGTRVVEVKRACCALLAVTALGACGTPTNDAPPTITVTSTTTHPNAQPPVPVDEPVGEVGVDKLLSTIADEVANQFGGTVAVAAGGVGSSDDPAMPAWSTIKVPLAVAAYRVAPDTAQLAAPAAITASDNDAALQLWNALPPGAGDTVLTEGGVPKTINTERIRPEFSTFGQTMLTAAEESTFMSNLSCLSGAGPVLELMGHIVPGQDYGLGQLPNARFKGGWGPSVTGGYEVRQMGLVSNSAGQDVALALVVVPADGSYQTGQAMANAVAEQLRGRLDQLPVAVC